MLALAGSDRIEHQKQSRSLRIHRSDNMGRWFARVLFTLLVIVNCSSEESCPASTPQSLRPCDATSDFAARYREDGFVVCPKMFTAEELLDLRSEIAAIARGERGAVQGLETTSQTLSDDASIISRYLAFHHPHKLSPVLKAALRHPRLVAVLQELIGPNIKYVSDLPSDTFHLYCPRTMLRSMQSMYFVKAPGKPGQAWHQDESYIPTRDRSLTGAFIAIDDASVENGCLWMHPGSHKSGVLWPMNAHNDSRFDPSGEATGFPFEHEGGVACESSAGTVVFFNGYVLHRSLPNKSPSRFRQALVGHFMSAESWLPWDADGTIVPRPHDNRDVFLVAGTDPNAHRGYVDNLTQPFIRPAQAQKGAQLKDQGVAAAFAS